MSGFFTSLRTRRTVLIVGFSLLFATFLCLNGLDINPFGDRGIAVADTYLPDLVPASFQITPQTTVGGAVSASWTVYNVGAPVTSANVGGNGFWSDIMYLSSDSQLGYGDVSINWSNFGPDKIQNGAYSADVTAYIPADTTPGDYFIILKVGYGLNQSNQENDLIVARISVVPSQPCDLVVTSFDHPASATAGERISASWTVYNDSQNMAYSEHDYGWYEHIYISDDDKLDPGIDPDITGFPVMDRLHLAGGDSYTVATDVNMQRLPVPQNLKAGKYYLIVQLDRDNFVAETNENNNIVVSDIYIENTDLAPTSIAVQPPSGSNHFVTVSWTALNQGDRGAYGSWLDSVCFSDDEQLDAGDKCTNARGGIDYGVIPPGQSYAQTVNYSDLEVGHYYYAIVKVNGSSMLGETNETNNIIVSQRFKFDGPDLVPVTLDAPASAAAGEYLPLSWTVVNQGPVNINCTAGSSYYCMRGPYYWTDAVYLSSDGVLDESDTLLGSGKLPYTTDWDWDIYLASGADYTVDRLITLPAVASGDYYLILSSDDPHYTAYYQVKEQDETNNVLARLIHIDACGRPDLRLARGQVSWGSFADYLARELSVSWLVSNAGVSDALGVTITGSYDTNGVTVLTSLPAAVGDIAPGGSSPIILRYHIPESVSGWTTSMTAAAMDSCGEPFVYP